MKQKAMLVIMLGACAALAQAETCRNGDRAEFHRCRVTGKTMPGAWVVANSGEITQAQHDRSLHDLTVKMGMAVS